MNIQRRAAAVLYLLPLSLFADNAYYCPQNHAYINIGMTMDEVIAACGQPTSKENSAKPLTQKIPVQQLIYNNQGTNTAFYGVWNIPIGSGGAQMEVDVVNNQIKGVRVNGADVNASSLCGGNGFQMDDPVSKVYFACGSPDIVNNTYVNQIIPTTTKPQVWIYSLGPYQSAISLTFVDGKLQSINN